MPAGQLAALQAAAPSLELVTYEDAADALAKAATGEALSASANLTADDEWSKVSRRARRI